MFLLPPLSFLSLLLPDLSDLESAFLHFTFLPVRREIDRTRRQDIRIWSKASWGTVSDWGFRVMESVILTDDDEDAQQEQNGSQSHAYSLHSVIV